MSDSNWRILIRENCEILYFGAQTTSSIRIVQMNACLGINMYEKGLILVAEFTNPQCDVSAQKIAGIGVESPKEA